MFNGSHGRLELEVVESTHRLPADGESLGGLIHGAAALPHAGPAKVTVQKLWQEAKELPVVYDHEGTCHYSAMRTRVDAILGHGGGDARMLNVLFGPLPGEAAETGDAAQQSANERDGTLALAVGLMANESFKTGQFVDIASLALPL